MSADNPFGLPILQGSDPLEYLDQWSASLGDALVRSFAPNIVAATGWSLLTVNAFRLLGKSFLWLDVTVNRTGADLPAVGSTGNMADVDVFQLTSPADAKPVRTTWLGGYRNGINQFTARMDTTGNVTLTDGVPGAVFPTATTLYVQGLVCLF